MKLAVIVVTASAALAIAGPTIAQDFDAAAEAKWSSVAIVHFEVVGEIADKHVQIPPVDADPLTEYVGPPDPQMFALAKMLPADSPITVTADGKSIVMKAQNNNWVWTYTPTVK